MAKRMAKTTTFFLSLIAAAKGTGKYPARVTPILICKYMSGWSFKDLGEAPAHRVDDIIKMMQAESQAQGGGSKEERRDSEYAARIGAR